MTCIVGLVTENGVMLGADTYGSNSRTGEVYATEKIFSNGKFIFGCTSSFRMIDILRYKFSLTPNLEDQLDMDRFFRTTFISHVKRIFHDNDYGSSKDGGTFIVGYNKTMVVVQDDYSILNPSLGIAAVGCGDQAGIGSLFTTIDSGQTPDERLLVALRAAQFKSPGVRGPFVLLDNFANQHEIQPSTPPTKLNPQL